jgi:hypothetical protein
VAIVHVSCRGLTSDARTLPGAWFSVTPESPKGERLEKETAHRFRWAVNCIKSAQVRLVFHRVIPPEVLVISERREHRPNEIRLSRTFGPQFRFLSDRRIIFQSSGVGSVDFARRVSRILRSVSPCKQPNHCRSRSAKR